MYLLLQHCTSGGHESGLYGMYVTMVLSIENRIANYVVLGLVPLLTGDG
jgi:hypothetical protein